MQNWAQHTVQPCGMGGNIFYCLWKEPSLRWVKKAHYTTAASLITVRENMTLTICVPLIRYYTTLQKEQIVKKNVSNNFVSAA